MDKFHRNKPAIRIKIISMGNAETGKVVHRASRARYAQMIHYFKYRKLLINLNYFVDFRVVSSNATVKNDL